MNYLNKSLAHSSAEKKIQRDIFFSSVRQIFSS